MIDKDLWYQIIDSEKLILEKFFEIFCTGPKNLYF